jgi:D-serine deaminase-like pyridoxal phosphate-dependent protein
VLVRVHAAAITRDELEWPTDRLPAIPSYELSGIVVVADADAGFAPGDVVYAVPAHVCPTVALHRQAYVVEDGRVTGQWDIAARDRVLRVA